MIDVIRKLVGDFLSTIVFVIVLLAGGNVVLATGVAIASAVAGFIYARIKQQKLDIMAWASLALVIVLGGATLLTHDPRFVLVKPSIAHFAIGAIMLRPGWMSRYMPPMVLEHAPELPVIAGYAWAVLMFALGAGTIAVAMTGDFALWTFYVSVVAVGAKVAAFGVQVVLFRLIMRRRLARRAGGASPLVLQ
ncbi:MAG: septation protein IspZ [Pseudomonadota bacterium]|jgi:intracellular septation protein A